MIKGILIVNNGGVCRIAKFYQPVHKEEEQPEVVQQLVIRKIAQLICSRPDSFCNYLEESIPQWGADTKLIYRHYATLYFVFARAPASPGRRRPVARAGTRERRQEPTTIAGARRWRATSGSST